MMFEDFPMYYSFISPLKSSYFQMTTYNRDEESLHMAGRVITTCVFSVCTRLGLRSVLGLGLALGS